MAKNKNAPYFYRQRRLDVISGVTFFLCLALVIWGTIEDHSREWKETQKVFHQKMQERLTGQLDAIATASDSTGSCLTKVSVSIASSRC